MDLIQDLMEIFVPLLSILLLPIFLPPFVLYKMAKLVSRSINKENLAGKVALITGASSGIGEHLAYEYAKRGACLVLVARREERLLEVAKKARRLGSPDVLVVRGDVSKAEDCKRSIAEAVGRFGRLDHLVNNAGIAPASMFDNCTDLDTLIPIMNINFWGSIYCTHFAVPHLRKTKGKIIAMASCAGWIPITGLSIYSGTKGALISFYETLRAEIGSEVGVTIVTPGLVASEITESEQFVTTVRSMVVHSPVESSERCAKAIVSRACQGEWYVMEPTWIRTIYYLNWLCPELIQWCERRVILITKPRDEINGSDDRSKVE